MSQRKPSSDASSAKPGPNSNGERPIMPPDLDPLEREMFEGLLQSLAAAGREVDADADAGDPSDRREEDDPSPRLDDDSTHNEPSLGDLEALEDELANDLDDDIDEDELASLLSGAADGGDAANGGDGGSPPAVEAKTGTSGEEALLAKLLGSFAKEAGLAAPEAEPPEETGAPKTPAQLIYHALERALAKLLDAELLEIQPGKKEDLLEQLLAPVLAASSVDAALQTALEGLVDSEHVEEVYGDDDELLGILGDAFEAVHREATQEK
ncbi:MAG: hypothetical protein KAI47_06965 [Deltaproteobacteria bacterium]|nr:hypothetical protein [Deltaproteobacteria bacterium]